MSVKLIGGIIMTTILDGKIFQLRMEYDLTRSQTDLMVSKIMADNEEKLLTMNSNDRDDFIYNTLVDQLEPQAEKVVNATNNTELESKEYRKVPLPAHNKVLRDKKFKLNTFACLMASSNKNKGSVKGMEFTNYIYDNKIDEAIEFIYETTGIKYSERTLNTHFKSIIDSGYDLVDLQNTPNGLVYMLRAEIDGGYYVTIPFIQLKELLLSTNKNALRLFILLKDMCDENSFTPIDRAFLARGIGLSDKSVKNLDTISTIVKTLAKMGMIEIMADIKKEVSKENPTKKQVKTIYAYRVCTLEEYLERDSKAIIKKRAKKTN